MPYNRNSSNQLAHYLKHRGPGLAGVDFEVVRAFVKAGADPLVSRYGDGWNLFEIASYYRWSNTAWLGLIDLCRAGKVTPRSFTYTYGLALYLKHRGPGLAGVDFEVVRAFVNAGADPLVYRCGDGSNLFKIASYDRWSSTSWLGLIDLCRAGKVTPRSFTDGLARYLTYQGPGQGGVDLKVIRAFVNAGADPLVSRYGDGSNLFEIASYNRWSEESYLELNSIVNLYRQCIQSHSQIAIHKTSLNEFDDGLKVLSEKIDDLKIKTHRQFGFEQDYKSAGIAGQKLLSEKIDDLKIKTHSQFGFEQDYKSASIAGQKLLNELTTQRKLYSEGTINIDTFRINCGTSIKFALETDLAKQHFIYRALVALLNVVLSLTIVVPVVTKLTTGRWGLFTNTKTESEKLVLEMSDVVKGLDDTYPPTPFLKN